MTAIKRLFWPALIVGAVLYFATGSGKGGGLSHFTFDQWTHGGNLNLPGFSEIGAWSEQSQSHGSTLGVALMGLTVLGIMLIRKG